MARCGDDRKRAEWRERLARFSGCGLTVARFCEAEQVSVAAFYQWRRKLGMATGRRRGRRPGPNIQPGTRTVHAENSQRNGSDCAPARRGTFQRVIVAGRPSPVAVATLADPAPEPAEAHASTAALSPARSVSMHLPGGTRIEVDVRDLDAVRAVVGELARGHGDLPSAALSC